MIVRSSPIIPDLKVAHFSCSVCAHSITATLERGRVSEPSVCPKCNVKNGYQLVHNRSLFADKQMVRIQETPDEVPAGETPASVVLFAYDDLVDTIRPGDRVEVTGILRAQPNRVHPKISKVKSVYKTYIDVIHFHRVDGDISNNGGGGISYGNKFDNNLSIRGNYSIYASSGTLSLERVKECEILANSPDIYEKLVRSLAPSI